MPFCIPLNDITTILVKTLLITLINVTFYIYMCVCVCVCVLFTVTSKVIYKKTRVNLYTIF
jgi:hypothetical protein